MKKNKQNNNNLDFDAIKLTLASPEQILEWSYGEVTKAETINYRTFKTEPDGLFCEKIFGPTKNYECFCGKYKKVRYKGIVCDKCGVEVTTKDVRRERMGHIELAVPAVHVWFAYGVPNKLSIILNIPYKKLLSVIYYTRYMVVNIDEDKRKLMETRVEEIHKAEEEDLKNRLEETLKEIEAEYAKEIKEVKSDKKLKKDVISFQVDKLEHEKKQALAEIRMEFAEEEEFLDSVYDKLHNLVTNLYVGQTLSEDEFIDMNDRDLVFFEAEMGADAIKKMLEKIDLESEIKKLQREISGLKGDKKMKSIRRLKYLDGFYKNNLKLEWLIISVLPVLPPELRPIVPLPGGKFAVSDINDLYRRIINRNNRLKRLIRIGAPEVILRNEKRMLQESVDALIDNQHRLGKPMMNSKRVPYKSLSDDLRGKKGIFRKNLLGKRVDYSGRAVIIGDTKLTLNECGLPKDIALEIFRPFIINKLIEGEYAPNIRVAKEMIDTKENIVWDLLEEIIKDRPVLLNRAPTLHKYSIQAFYPRLIEGTAIRIHPLVCAAFNADFDGDQMSVHIPLTDEAVEESKELMIASKNIVKIANGKILAKPSKDMVLGIFMLTDMEDGKADKKDLKKFASIDDAVKAYYRGLVSSTEQILVKTNVGLVVTSAGRALFNSILPEDYPYINEQLNGSAVGKLIADIREKYDHDVVVQLLDDLKYFGFIYATLLGFSFAMEDCNIDMDLDKIIEEYEKKDDQLMDYYMQGLITKSELEDKSLSMWDELADKLSEEAWNALDRHNSIYEMVQSGANGGKIQARQILTIKGLVRGSGGKWIPVPIKGNYRDGLNSFEYFVQANGGRKGIVDRSLKTSVSGYFSRKLVDVAHDLIIRSHDCGYDGEGLRLSADDVRKIDFEHRIAGRFTTKDISDKKGKVIVKKGEMISSEAAAKIVQAGIKDVYVRSPLLCEAPLGLCQKCYGQNIETGKLVEIGKAVGVIAAQSIGEPGTQMTMNTFHKGGVQKTDITQGLPSVIKLFDALKPKVKGEIATVEGTVTVNKLEDDSTEILIVGKRPLKKEWFVGNAKKVAVEDGVEVKSGDLLFIAEDETEKQAPFAGTITYKGGILSLSGTIEAQQTVRVYPGFEVYVKNGEKVEIGKQLSEGGVDVVELAEAAGVLAAQRYVIDTAQQVYVEQSVEVADVHFEVIARQMARLAIVLNPGDSNVLVGSMVNRHIAKLKNKKLLETGKNMMLLKTQFTGIKASSLHTEGFLSAMSFEQQVRVLTDAAITGKVDYLRGMKENVIIGRKIPAGKEAEIKDFDSIQEVSNF